MEGTLGAHDERQENDCRLRPIIKVLGTSPAISSVPRALVVWILGLPTSVVGTLALKILLTQFVLVPLMPGHTSADGTQHSMTGHVARQGTGSTA